jgi:hypothetical protein
MLFRKAAHNSNKKSLNSYFFKIHPRTNFRITSAHEKYCIVKVDVGLKKQKT